MNKNILLAAGLILLLVSGQTRAQGNEPIVMTGARFFYPILEKWIADYEAEYPGKQVTLIARGMSDPEGVELVVDAYPDLGGLDPQASDVFQLARYAVLPIANAQSAFAKTYAPKGLSEKEIKALYFNDLLAENDQKTQAPASSIFYTRLQKAGLPTAFAQHYGYGQSRIKGKAIAGADEHLLKAVQKDPEGVGYATPALAYDVQTRLPKEGLTVIPTDLDGNGKVSAEEKAPANLDALLAAIQAEKGKGLPIAPIYLHFKTENHSLAALHFAQWLLEKGTKDLAHFGYLSAPEPVKEQQKFGVYKVSKDK